MEVPYIGLVNIVAGRKIVPEFVQHEMTEEKIGGAVRMILTDPTYAAGLKRDLSVIKERLGGPGASARVAAGIVALGRAA